MQHREFTLSALSPWLLVGVDPQEKKAPSASAPDSYLTATSYQLLHRCNTKHVMKRRDVTMASL